MSFLFYDLDNNTVKIFFKIKLVLTLKSYFIDYI